MKLILKADNKYTIETRRGTTWCKVYKKGTKGFIAFCAELQTAYQVIFKETDGKHGKFDDSSFKKVQHSRIVEV